MRIITGSITLQVRSCIYLYIVIVHLQTPHTYRIRWCWWYKDYFDYCCIMLYWCWVWMLVVVWQLKSVVVVVVVVIECILVVIWKVRSHRAALLTRVFDWSKYTELSYPGSLERELVLEMRSSSTGMSTSWESWERAISCLNSFSAKTTDVTLKTDTTQ